jgi:signal transduction histidine kinase
MESYLQRFLTLSRPRPANKTTVSLDALVDDVVALVQPACLHAAIEMTVSKPASPLYVQGDAEELRQLVINLALNAVDAASGQVPSAAKIRISLDRIEEVAALCVEDSGPGPADDVAARLFEPFVTGKPEGTGLGLFVARQIAEDHHGTIRFIVELPLWMQ